MHQCVLERYLCFCLNCLCFKLFRLCLQSVITSVHVTRLLLSLDGSRIARLRRPMREAISALRARLFITDWRVCLIVSCNDLCITSVERTSIFISKLLAINYSRLATGEYGAHCSHWHNNNIAVENNPYSF